MKERKEQAHLFCFRETTKALKHIWNISLIKEKIFYDVFAKSKDGCQNSIDNWSVTFYYYVFFLEEFLKHDIRLIGRKNKRNKWLTF